MSDKTAFVVEALNDNKYGELSIISAYSTKKKSN